MNNLLEQIQNTHGSSTGTIACSGVGRVEWESTHCELHDSQAHTPHIRADGISTTLDTFRGHVRGSTDKGIGDRVHGFGGDTEVAQFDIAARVDQNIGRLDITVHNAVGFVEIDQTRQDRLGDLSEDVDSDRAKILGDTIEGPDSTPSANPSFHGLVADLPAIHVFHAQHNVSRIILESAIKGDDVGRGAVVSHPQFSEDLFPHVLFGVNSDDLAGIADSATCAHTGKRSLEPPKTYLSGHNHIGRSMLHLGDGASISGAEFLQRLQVLAAEIQAEFQPNFQGIGAVAVGISNRSGDLSIPVGRLVGLGVCIEGEAFDVLPFQRPGLELVRHGVGRSSFFFSLFVSIPPLSLCTGGRRRKKKRGMAR